MPKGVRKNNPRTIPERDWLEQKFVIEGLTTRQIAAMTGYSNGGMSNLLWRFGLRAGGAGSRQKIDIDRDRLYQMHVVEGLTAVRIAAMLGVHNGTISKYISRYGLDPGRPLVNARSEPPADRDSLWKMYWVDGMSLRQIGTTLRASASTVARWFDRLDIPKRKWNGGEFARTYVRSETSRRDGKEFSGYQRARIIRRDGGRCQMPGCRSTLGLEVNHILPVEYGGEAVDENGITLCRPCHASIRRREMGFKVLFDQIVKRNSG